MINIKEVSAAMIKDSQERYEKRKTFWSGTEWTEEQKERIMNKSSFNDDRSDKRRG